jgi:hypothetical protein
MGRSHLCLRTDDKSSVAVPLFLARQGARWRLMVRPMDGPGPIDELGFRSPACP